MQTALQAAGAIPVIATPVNVDSRRPIPVVATPADATHVTVAKGKLSIVDAAPASAALVSAVPRDLGIEDNKFACQKN